MRIFSKLLLAFSFCLCLLLPCETRADNVVITAGNFTPRSVLNGDGPFTLSGQGLTINGGTDIGRSLSCFGCEPGSLLNFGHYFEGSDFRPGAATINGIDYQRLFYQGNLSFTGSYQLPLDNSPLTVVAPFTFSGALNGYLQSPFVGDPGPAIFSTGLTGQGLATLQLFSMPTADGSRYFLTGIRYDFQGPSSVPEPATLLLLGTGLTGIAMRYRHRRQHKI